MNLWRKQILGGSSTIRIEDVRKFDSGVDSVNYSAMSTQTYWCPHEADFLNWRFFDNPLFSYVAQVALDGDEVRGYSVIRVHDGRAMLMEFAVPTEPEFLSRVLFAATIAAARKAGCYAIGFYATPSFRYWDLIRRAGFITRPSEVYVGARCEDRQDRPLEY